MEDEIEHLSHKHRLQLKYDKSHKECAACLDYLYGDIYCCYDCRYNLHEECAKLEDEIEHFHHSFQSLKLHGIDVTFNCKFAMCVKGVVRASATVVLTVISKWIFYVHSNQRFGCQFTTTS